MHLVLETLMPITTKWFQAALSSSYDNYSHSHSLRYLCVCVCWCLLCVNWFSAFRQRFPCFEPKTICQNCGWGVVWFPVRFAFASFCPLITLSAHCFRGLQQTTTTTSSHCICCAKPTLNSQMSQQCVKMKNYGKFINTLSKNGENFVFETIEVS